MYHPVSGRAIIALLTDFGSVDGYVGIMKAVMAGISSHACFIDITHEIEPQRIAAGAWTLATSYRYFPDGTVFLCIVDPGVGSERRAIALAAGHWLFVGPDNGLFSYVLAEQPIHNVVELTNPAYHLEQISATFHGRDLFAPVSAHLARGIALEALGPQIDPITLQRLPVEAAVRRLNRLEARIVHIDHFGNLITNIPLNLVPDLFSAPAVQLLFVKQGRVITERRRFFGATETDREGGGRPFLYGDSSGYVAIAVRNGRAENVLGAGHGAALVLEIREE